MKKIYMAVLAIIMSLGLISCSNNIKKEEVNKYNDKIKVYATIFPVYDFAKNIGKDKIELNYIVPPSSEPHDYEISAKTIKDIQNADLLIKNGLGIDGFSDNIKSESDKLNILVASEGIEKITYKEEGHDEDQIEEEHEHGKYDPHVWLDINNAIKECENIKNEFIKIDSKNKGYYEENYNNYVKELKDLGAVLAKAESSLNLSNTLTERSTGTTIAKVLIFSPLREQHLPALRSRGGFFLLTLK